MTSQFRPTADPRPAPCTGACSVSLGVCWVPPVGFPWGYFGQSFGWAVWWDPSGLTLAFVVLSILMGVISCMCYFCSDAYFLKQGRKAKKSRGECLAIAVALAATLFRNSLRRRRRAQEHKGRAVWLTSAPGPHKNNNMQTHTTLLMATRRSGPTRCNDSDPLRPRSPPGSSPTTRSESNHTWIECKTHIRGKSNHTRS